MSDDIYERFERGETIGLGEMPALLDEMRGRLDAIKSRSARVQAELTERVEDLKDTLDAALSREEGLKLDVLNAHAAYDIEAAARKEAEGRLARVAEMLTIDRERFVLSGPAFVVRVAEEARAAALAAPQGQTPEAPVCLYCDGRGYVAQLGFADSACPSCDGSGNPATPTPEVDRG